MCVRHYSVTYCYSMQCTRKNLTFTREADEDLGPSVELSERILGRCFENFPSNKILLIWNVEAWLLNLSNFFATIGSPFFYPSSQKYVNFDRSSSACVNNHGNDTSNCSDGVSSAPVRNLNHRVNNAAREAALLEQTLLALEHERPNSTTPAYKKKQQLFNVQTNMLKFWKDLCMKNHNEDGTSCLITRKRLLRFLNEEVVPEGNLKKGANRIAQYMRIEVMGSI